MRLAYDIIKEEKQESHSRKNESQISVFETGDLETSFSIKWISIDSIRLISFPRM